MIRNTAGKYSLNKIQVKITTIVNYCWSSNDVLIKVAKNKGTFRYFIFYASAEKEFAVDINLSVVKNRLVVSLLTTANTEASQ